MEKDGFTYSESLSIIQEMINKAKDQFSENGHLYLLWGWVILTCSIGHFILLHVVRYEHHSMIWILTWVAVLYQFVYLRKQRKNQKVKTYTHDIIGFIWLTFFILMMLLAFFSIKALGDQFYRIINPGFLALYGMPTFLSGITLRFRPLIVGGICCWTLSIIAIFIPYSYQLLLLGAAVIIAWIIPGYILRARFKKINA